MPSLPKSKSQPFLKVAALLAVGATLIPPAASAGEVAQHHETMQERQVCTPDVLRLCRSLVPDRQAITDCLNANSERLSPACHEVMAQRQ
ncbi:hypothetical protein [Methylobacterium sp. GC_Met_2]|uniref:hypothetical protein n=1 Tax=Methylobacterium sp. GC_Met_2 TaxID=2937376 RepID=UPI00226B7E64|nr:hypothetical protein [Methylobacterium sp. GC_Met_2]